MCLGFLLLCAPAIVAQVNIFTGETMRQMRLDSGLYNSISLDLTYRTGNTDILTARTRFRSDYIGKRYNGFVFGSLQEDRKNGTFLINKGLAHARIIRSVTQRILLESFVQKQFNESILLNDRNLIGGGVRLASHPRNSRFNVYLGIGAMWEHEQINTPGGVSVTRIVRSTNYINWTGEVKKWITTSATGYYQVDVRHLQDYRILFEGSLTFRLTTKLSFPLRVNVRYDSDPPHDIRKHDVEIFNGLRYTF